MAMCRAWNRWAHEAYADFAPRILPMAALSPGDRDGTLAEIAWATDHGFRGLTLPCKPVWGAHDADAPNYNLPEFDWLWAARSEEHTSELQSLMRISYAVFCLKK